MKKDSFTFSKRLRSKKAAVRLAKFYKRYRHKRARRSKDPELIYKQTDAWKIS